MFRPLVAGLSFVAVVVSGCPGRECSTDADCAPQLQCLAEGRCVALDAGVAGGGGGGGGGDCPDTSIPSAPNVLKNPGAECGTTGWFPPDVVGKATVAQETSNPHTGAAALKITATGSGNAHVYNDAEITAQANETWCAQAWMRGGTASDGRIGVRHWPTQDPSSFIDDEFSSPVTQTWTAVPQTKGLMKFTTTQPETMQLRIVMQNAVAGETLIVDDVALWKSASGACTER